jgi:type II secretory pathway component PulM
MDSEHGLTLFMGYWKATRSLELAMRQAYGLTLADFERRWRQRTRRQYGALALVSNVTLAALLLLFVLTPLYVARRRRDRRRLERMKEADAAAERAEQSAIDDLLR